MIAAIRASLASRVRYIEQIAALLTDEVGNILVDPEGEMISEG